VLQHLHAASALAVDDGVEAAVAQELDHLHVLALHQRPHVGGYVDALYGVRVASLVALDDAPAVREAVRDDVRLAEAGVLGLHVVVLPLVLHVVVEADLRLLKDGPRLAVEPRQLVGREARDGLVEVPVVAGGDALHALEGHLGDRALGLEAQRLGEQRLAVGVVRPGRGPGGEHEDGVCALASVAQRLGHALGEGARIGSTSRHRGAYHRGARGRGQPSCLRRARRAETIRRAGSRLSTIQAPSGLQRGETWRLDRPRGALTQSTSSGRPTSPSTSAL
jgi:hypothetical protein